VERLTAVAKRPQSRPDGRSDEAGLPFAAAEAPVSINSIEVQKRRREAR
jgi:hypothetical protein